MTGTEQKLATRPPAQVNALTEITVAAFLILTCQAYLLWTSGLNWDEFHHYDILRRLDDGTLSRPLQTFFGHLFTWILYLPGDIVDHVRVARVIMLVATLGTVLMIFGTARYFTTDRAAGIVALSYLSAGFVTTQSVTFRADALAAFLLMASLYLLTAFRLGLLQVVLFGFLTGLSAMVTIKVVFYAPAFLGVAWMRFQGATNKGRYVASLSAAVTTSLLVFFTLYIWHAQFVTEPAVDAGLELLDSAWSTVFSAGFFPKGAVFASQIILAPHVSVFVFLTVLLFPVLNASRSVKIALAGLLLPLTVLLIYRNGYGYFYVFILPPVLVAVAGTVEQFIMKRTGTTWLSLFLAVWGIFLALIFIDEKQEIRSDQKELVAIGLEIFRQPVAYFDDVGALGDYRRVLPFMATGWGLQRYHSQGIPLFSNAMAEETIPLLITNSYVLEEEMSASSEAVHLLEEDAKALSESYIQHWGSFWVAGSHIPEGIENMSLMIRIPGVYTVENAPLVIDDILIKPGDSVDLQRGAHEIGGPRDQKATLRWGTGLYVPETPPITWRFVLNSSP